MNVIQSMKTFELVITLFELLLYIYRYRHSNNID